MMKNYFTSIVLMFVLQFVTAQEMVNLSGYDGSPLNFTATSTVNDNITIIFEDVDIINNFYTQFQSVIYMFGGLDTTDGGFQGSPDFNDLGSQPVLNLVASDTDDNAAPNTYSLTINLAQHYSAVPDGTMVFGFNLLFQNQFGGGGNNQTVDLYIDLADAMKNSILSIVDELSLNNIKIDVRKKRLFISGYNGSLNYSLYNIMGQKILTKNNVNVSNSYSFDLLNLKDGIYILKLDNDNTSRTMKVLLR
ncbi:MAG: T9SS type A sorting domain-containing protein [Winogradskyella sp.]|nr:T9SS type A sorting domain-containing protein [Winogradskyella sp.]